jgi:hypothetical protein
MLCQISDAAERGDVLLECRNHVNDLMNVEKHYRRKENLLKDVQCSNSTKSGHEFRMDSLEFMHGKACTESNGLVVAASHDAAIGNRQLFQFVRAHGTGSMAAQLPNATSGVPASETRNHGPRISCPGSSGPTTRHSPNRRIGSPMTATHPSKYRRDHSCELSCNRSAMK